MVDTSGLHHVFKEMRNETRAIAGLSWFKTAQGGLSLKMEMRYSKKSGAKRRGWKPDDSRTKVAAETLTDCGNWNVVAPLPLETAKSHRKLESKEMSVTELKLKSLLLRKKRDGRQLGRRELNWLCRAIWRQRRALTREKHPNTIKESAETVKSPQENTKQSFQLELDCETGKSSQTSSTTSVQSRRTMSPNPRDSTGQNN